jgi:hypothetical protein
MFLVYSVLFHQFSQKTAPSLYFLADLNNSHTILTRIVWQFRFFFKNQNPTTAAWLALFFTVWNQNLLLYDQFLSYFNDSRPILTRILTVLNVFSKSESDFCSLNSDDLVCSKNCHWKLCFEFFFKPSIFVKSSTIPWILAVLCYEDDPWGVEWRFSSFTLSEWWPGLCSKAGDPPFNKIFIGAAYLSHRVKRGKIRHAYK